MTDLKLSSTAKALIQDVEADKAGSAHLRRAERRALLARQLRQSAELRGFSVRGLAEAMGTSPSQAQRVISMETPNVTLDTILRAADAMGVTVEFIVRDPLGGNSG